MKLQSIGKNQTVVTIGDNEIFFSYETPVAGCIDGIWYKTGLKHSATTTRHINNYLEGIEAKTMGQDFFNSLVKG